MTFTLSTFTESRGWLWLHGRDGLGRRRTFVVAAVQRRFWLIVFMERIDVTLVDDRLHPFPGRVRAIPTKTSPGRRGGREDRKTHDP